MNITYLNRRVRALYVHRIQSTVPRIRDPCVGICYRIRGKTLRSSAVLMFRIRTSRYEA